MEKKFKLTRLQVDAIQSSLQNFCCQLSPKPQQRWHGELHEKGVIFVPDQYRAMDRMLGRGAFGRVLMIETIDKAEKKAYMALKDVKLADPLQWHAWGSLFRELYMLRYLQRCLVAAEIVQFHLAHFDPIYRRLSIVFTPYADNMWEKSSNTALEYLTLLTPPEIKALAFTPCRILRASECRSMFRILETLARHHILHGDAKPDQFLWDKHGQKLVLGDFGCAGFIHAKTAILHQERLFTHFPMLRDSIPPFLQASTGWVAQMPFAFCIDAKSPWTPELTAAISWFDIWCLDLYLWYYDVWIWDDSSNGADVCTRYGRVSLDILPLAVELTLLQRIACADAVSSGRRPTIDYLQQKEIPSIASPAFIVRF